jgi:hypothetical protein
MRKVGGRLPKKKIEDSKSDMRLVENATRRGV